MCKFDFSKNTNEILFFFISIRTSQPSYRTNLFVCHHCKQPGHIKNHCPSLLVGSSTLGMDLSHVKITDKQHRSLFSSAPFCNTNYFNADNKAAIGDTDKPMSRSPFPSRFDFISKKVNSSISHFYFLQSSSTGSASNTSSSGSSGGDGSQSTNSGAIRSAVPHGSHIVTRHAPYQMPYHHRGNRSHRGAGHPRGEPIPKKTTGIPRDRLIPVPKHIPGALRDQTGASVVPRQMA
jgi:hypothetical protein